MQALDIDAINDVLAQLAGATDRNKELVPQLIEHLTSVGAAIQARDAELRELVGQRPAHRRHAGRARRGDRAARRRGRRAARAPCRSAATSWPRSSGEGSEAVAALTRTITEHRAAIDGILADAHVLLDGVDRRLGDLNTGLAYAGPIFQLLGAVAGPEGGFDVAVEGFVATADQLRGLLSLLFPEVRS